ncbi:uncharacterized protein LOC132262047 [Phlebotomus argentipes]|uniref:uncharacterized protein LOC132262047 n=1 Tax=Phlebotomus argentipes TaxID=94469 RepID=UPI002892EB10|nr:uncharacterized protein LOC132262047 [Phlebotomus argentipes]
MVRVVYIALVAFLAIATAQQVAEELPAEVPIEEIPTKAIAVESVEEFMRQNPGVTLLEMKAEQRALTRYYTLGRRVSGDFYAAYARGTNSYGSPRFVSVRINYSGYIVTYIQVSVQQSSNSGRAYVVSGGIGQRSIGFIVEASSTTQFNYNADIYARK